MPDKFAVAQALREIGALLELEGENPFKIRAYDTGARALEGLSEDLARVIAEGRLTELPGIGEALAKKIADLHATGSTDLLARLRARHPPGVLELLRVPDLGPKKIAALHAALGVASVAELEAACREGRVRGVKGFGEKTEQRILEGIARLHAREADRRVLLAEALTAAEPLLAHLRAVPGAEAVELAGSARRGRELVGDVDLVAASRTPAALAAALTGHPLVAAVLGSGDTKTSVRLGSGLQVDLRVVPPEDFPTLLHHLTGSKAHHVRLRGIARDRGFTLSEWGLFRLPPRERGAAAPAAEAAPDPAAKVPIASEAALYAALGLAYVPPELREDQGEIEAALDGTLPADLVEARDVRGMVHCHTTWSDGRASVEEMARAAEALGMAYLTVTDHSGSAGYAGGLDRDRIRRQWDEIDGVQERVSIRLLKGTEADILEDGALDWPDDVLERLDVVVASVHSRMRMDEDQMTRRLARAMALPVFKIWGHGLGRLLGEREPYACRVEEVLDALAGAPGAVEVNGDPRRLDLEPRWIRAARARGIPLVLSVDAHSVAALGYLRFAVTTARRGWARRGEVLNALPADAFARAVRPVR
ncbi:PHP domain protein [Anaeromyxobacter dehalogenans 2CP-1]|uniref:DNA-directed DNA polymerase n=1 Tax=Anaeromyxobacter dehalogenans (strain ATCC BAA-258 / DSM 21875 / 2CP-1) TaxID=455488 RepID=B8JH31_ANAD2|nr:DNA polymerase/3'-5' exonuclease PolX [Anaeromyxobacter dehalogenans]ACL64733.1 PHP domain protein [Anaeromyxobacter dehalogenans 2CP-1]